MLRLFAAIAPDEAVRAALDEALQPARRSALEGVRWLDRTGWHFTLQFFGAVPDALAEPLAAALGQAAARHAPSQVALAGAGAFPSIERARVVWVGVSEGANALTALADDVATACQPLGFERDARPFRPHLTIARLRRPASLTQLLARIELPALRFEMRELILYRSHLSPQGARYEALARLPLSGPAGPSPLAGST